MRDIGLLILRLAFGGSLFLAHGWGKFAGFREYSASFPDPIGLGSPVSLGLAVFAEVFCAVAIVLGFKTKWAAIPAFITMFVAFFVIHAGDPFKTKELAFAYGIVFATLFLTGPGKISLDAMLKGKDGG